jgi:hypothetical protein
MLKTKGKEKLESILAPKKKEEGEEEGEETKQINNTRIKYNF